jgi:hypothetical protein
MESVLTYRGRGVTEKDVEFIRALRFAHPNASRRALSLKLCAAWGWVQPNGVPRDMVCRGLLLALHRAGHVELPPPRGEVRKIPPRPRRPVPVSIEDTPVIGSLRELGEIEFRQVRRTSEEALVNGLIETHHYLRYVQPVGEHLKYLVVAGSRPLACFVWSSAPRHLKPRDRFIGWSSEVRRGNLRLVAYNSRFLILPWVKVPHLASHLLGWMARHLPAEWQRVYGHPVHLFETFVDGERFRGTCYRAANWVWVGRTTGRGKADQTHRVNRSIKDVWVYPLGKDFRERLARGAG